jgi:DNA invertase Pin-like site-specific DNA recombinase
MSVHKSVALYARVSSQKQADENTIDSQLAALRQRILQDQLQITPEMEFCDNGFSGAELVRPALERLRDRLAMSSIDRLYVLSPDRLSRKMAHQAILVEEFRKSECELVFLNQDGITNNPEANLLVQMQGMIAEYEREKILERTRRGRKHSATKGNVSVFSGAPYGYRYISKAQNDGAARWEIDPIQSEHVRDMFHWVGDGDCSLAEVVRRLAKRSINTVRGKSRWDCATIRGILINPAYHARDYRVEGQLFVDAMHIYSVKDVVDCDRLLTVRIIWSHDSSKSALLINGALQGVFDFKARVGYCVDEFPEPASGTGWQRMGWSPELKNWFDHPDLEIALTAMMSFYSEIAEQQIVWAIRDKDGFPTSTVNGKRAMPFWSSKERAEAVIKESPRYAGSEPYAITWANFREMWLVGMERDGIQVGINWTGAKAVGYDLDPRAVSIEIGSRIESGQKTL